MYGLEVSDEKKKELVNELIEDLAWKIFQRKTGISFIRELTPEEKKSVTDVESYQQYRDEAKKMYEKKIAALNNKRYPVIEVPADGKTGRMGGAYCLCFVYSKYNGNFVVKGYLREVEEYLKKNHTHYFCNKSLWYDGFNRDIWDFWRDRILIYHPSIRDKRKGKKIEVRPYMDYMTEEEKDEKIFHFKRMPKRWIPEFDVL